MYKQLLREEIAKLTRERDNMREDALVRMAMAASAAKQADKNVEKLLTDFDQRLALERRAVELKQQELQQKQQELDQLKSRNAELAKQLAAAKSLLSKV